jgi:hypothetical protein
VKEYIDVLNPTARTTAKQERMASDLTDLNGTAIGLVDNRKPNFDIFLERVEKVLCQRFQFGDIVRLKKGGTGATVPLTPEEMAQLVPRCDAIICGICD